MPAAGGSQTIMNVIYDRIKGVIKVIIRGWQMWATEHIPCLACILRLLIFSYTLYLLLYEESLPLIGKYYLFLGNKFA